MDKDMKELVKGAGWTFGSFGCMAVVVLLINGALLAGAVYLVVKVLQWTGVL
jgi:hypothetical protein